MEQRDRFLRLGFIASKGLNTGVSVGGGAGPNSGFLMLMDEESNQLLALIDTDYFGAVRVGAEGGLGAKYLKKDARVLGMLGSGYQARTAMPAMIAAVPGLERIKVFSPTQANARSSARRCQTGWAARSNLSAASPRRSRTPTSSTRYTAAASRSSRCPR